MPRISLDKLRRALADKSPAAAYYIHGSEHILKDEALALIQQHALDPATRDFNLDILSAQQLDPSELASACSTLPMMAERRVVILRDVEAWKRKSKGKLPAVQYLEKPLSETVLVIVQGNDEDADEELASRCVAVDCAPLIGEQLAAWLTEQLRVQDVRLADDAREHLVRATGGDLGLLSAEILKLGGLAGSTEIDVATVGALVGVRFGETVDDWRDAVLRDETARAVALVPRLLEISGTSGVKLVTTLGSSLVVLSWARAIAERQKIRDAALAERVKRDLLFKSRPAVGSYDPVARLMGQIVGRWSPARIRAAVVATLQADIALKNTTISDEAGIVTDLVLTLGASRTRKAA